MKLSLQKALSLVLVFVMVLGMIPFAAYADEAQPASEVTLPTSMEGLSISYPYNTETVKQTGTAANRFNALTFESARNEVESAQMILSPNFVVDSFKLTMNGLTNENGNIIPGWAFDVFIQHYVSVSGSGNAANWSDTYQMYNPTYSTNGNDGIFPDSLIPQDAAIEAGENKIAAGQNGGIWVNLNVQSAAPGTYTGFAILTVNGTDMQIPVSVRIYDVSLPEEVHTKSSVGIWWDMVQFGEGTDMTRELGDAYFDYLVSKRIMPLDAWNITRWDDAFVEYAIEYLAVSPEISAYSIHQSKGTLDVDDLRTTLTYMIQENIEQIEAGNNIDLFKKAYLYIIDEPRTDSAYAQANTITAQLDALKAELSPLLADYPALQESFMNLKQLVTSPNPLDKTYADKGTIFNTFIDDDYGNTALTGDSYIYAPQYQWLNTADQRAMYAGEEELWWYGCCHPIAPFPTYHINNPLVSARVESWMRYAYGIDGFVYSSVNIWGTYNTSGSTTTLDHFDYWNSYVNNGTPGDQILVLPGSDYGVLGPIGTIRIENIREGNEDYEYLWMLENEYGEDISAYTANLYSGTIPSDDASVHYNNRKALLSRLEELSIAANGATEIAPGNEGFDRGEAFEIGVSENIAVNATEEIVGLSFDYKITNGSEFGIALMDDWTKYYGYYYFNANGATSDYVGVTTEKLDDGYIRVIFDMAALTAINADSTGAEPTSALDFLYMSSSRVNASGYIDNIQIIDEIPKEEEPTEEPTEVPTEPEPTVPSVQEVFEGGSFTSGGGLTIGLDNDQPVTTMSFDYQITSGTSFTVALMPGSWSNYYGNFTLTANGASYDGLQVQPLENGYMRVFVDFTQLTTTTGTPTSTVIDTMYLRGANCSADGAITNIRINSSAETPVPGTYFPASTNTNFNFDEGNYKTVSFEYKLISGEMIAVCVGNSDLSKYYGYYDIYANGDTCSNVGVTVEALDNGYYRITLELDQLQKTNGSVPETVSRIYIRGSYSDAAGFLGNITYTLPCSHSYDAVVTAPSFAANGYTTYTCTLCGESYVGDETAAYTFAVPQWNIALADDIRANFHLNVDSRLTDAAVTVLVDGNGYRYNLSELTTTEDGYYVVSANVAAAQMTDEITIQVVSGENVSEVKSYSIRGYAEYILTNSDDENTMLLVQRMLNYGAAAQNYFTYNTDNLANDGYEMTDTPEIPEAEEGSVATGTVEGISYYGASLLFETRIGVRFYFTVTGDINNYTFSNGAKATFKNGMYYVDVLNINPNEYDDTIELSVTDGTDTLTVGYSPLRYISRKYHGSDNTDLVALVGAMYQYHKAAELFLNENDGEPEKPQDVFDGGAFAAGSGLTLDLTNEQSVTRLTFDYKIDSGDYFNIAWMSDWSNWYGYFEFNATGAASTYAGLTTRDLGDGTIRVYIDLSQVTEIKNSPSDVLKIVYIRGSETTANGTISNICFNDAAEVAPRGDLLLATVGKTYEWVNTENLETLSFEYKIVDGTKFAVALMPNWSSYYGYYNFDANGALSNNSGVTTEVLEDGYIRVTFELAALDVIYKEPTPVITMLYFRGGYCDADVYIDNIQYTVAEPVVRGKSFSAGANSYFYTECEDIMSVFSFEYKITNDGMLDIYIGNDDGRYGNYYLYASGEQTDYEGITTEVLEDGYIRATFQLDVLSGSTGVSITYLRFRSTTTASGYVDNMKWNAIRGTQFNAGSNSYVYTDCADELSQFVFEYKVTNDGVMDVLIGNGNGQYGNFYFDANGAVTSLSDKTVRNYDGVSVEVLDDGYIRVTFMLNELTTVYRGTPGNVIEYVRIRSTSTAAGYVDNLQVIV